MKASSQQNLLIKRLFVFSFIGILLFFISAITALYLYPGGTAVNPKSIGYNLQHNYWCDLFAPVAHNGQLNEGMLFAKLATLSISFGLSFFWIAAPIKIIKNSTLRVVAQCSGVLAMLLASVMFTGHHDLVLILGGMFGGIASLILLYYLSAIGEKTLFKWGVLCAFLVCSNNLIYFGDFMIGILPVLQKLSFIVVIGWVVGISIFLLSNENI